MQRSFPYWSKAAAYLPAGACQSYQLKFNKESLTYAALMVQMVSINIVSVGA